MRRFSILAAFVFVAATVFSQSKFVVQVGAFDEKMPKNYFASLEGVYEEIDHNDIHHYYIGGFKDEATARTAAEKAQKLGFRARVINMDERRSACGTSCRPRPVKWLFFDYDMDFLRSGSKSQLDKLAEILKENPSYKVNLGGHTDAHGSDGYNIDLSRRRAENSKTYLVAQGIDASRVSTNPGGETEPIAINEKSGADSPSGRQLNRRVEIKILDEKNKERPELVDETLVPSYLKG